MASDGGTSCRGPGADDGGVEEPRSGISGCGGCLVPRTIQADSNGQHYIMGSVAGDEGLPFDLYLNPTKKAQAASEAKKVSQAIRHLYATGTPFFTKEAIEHLVRQMDSVMAKYRNGESIEDSTFVLRGLDGNTVNVIVEVGKARGPRGWEVVQYDMSRLTSTARKLSFEVLSP